MSNILISVYSLASKNNGFFKSEKQAQFLISELDKVGGSFIEYFTFGYTGKEKHSRFVTVSYDTQGITEIRTKAEKSGKESVKFTRKTDQEFAAIQAAKIAEYNAEVLQSITAIENNIAELQAIIDSVKAENTATLEKVKQATQDQTIITSMTDSLDQMLAIKTTDQVKQIEFWTEKLIEVKARLK